jgi:phosphatidate phosphatase LPIN
MTSMPGTLDEMHFGIDDEEEDEDVEGHENDDNHFGRGEGADGEEVYDGGEDDDGAEEEIEEAFDDDLLAAGEMQNVPFL